MISIKYFSPKLALFLLSSFVLVGCNKDDSSSSTAGTPSGNSSTYLTAKVDGVDFEVQGNLFTLDQDLSGIIYTPFGADNETNTITIGMGISNMDGLGDYTILDSATQDPLTDSYVSGFFYEEGDATWSSLSFSTFSQDDSTSVITMTEINEEYLGGTFQFKGYDLESETVKEITEGTFRFKRI